MLETLKLPVFHDTPFDDIRKLFGQKFLEEYNEWSKKDAGSIFYLHRMNYFNIYSPKLIEYIKYRKLNPKQLEFNFKE